MLIILGARKAKAIKSEDVNRKQAALNNKEWPDDVVKVSNNISNQFEVPVLFYVLCLILYNINAVDVIAVALAWLFVVSRYLHAYVHIGSNYVPLRLKFFLTGCLTLIAILLLVIWKLVTAS